LPIRVQYGGGPASLRTGKQYRIVVPKKSPPPAARGLRFLRGRDFDLRAPGGRQVPTLVALPLEASVVGRLRRAGKRPLESELVSIEVYDGQGTNAKVRSGRETAELPLSSSGGTLLSGKKLLFWHGERGDLGGASWPDVQLVEVTASGEDPFEAQVEVTCGDARGTLGLFDILAEDPESAGAFRTLRHGLFRSRTPRLKICSGGLDPAQLRFVLDDGADQTDDEIDVSGLVAGQADVQLPAYTRLGSGATGAVNQLVGRKRVVQESVEEPPAEGDCALFLFGENRLRVEMGGEPIFISRSFHYAADDETVPGGFFQSDEVEIEGGRLRVIKGSLTLDFRDAASDAQVSRALHALRARPRSFAGRYNVVEAHFGDDVGGAGLLQLRNEVDEQHDPDIEAVGLTPLLVPSLAGGPGVQERLPQALLSNFVAANHTFTNADDHWHHFVIHTFPAHRLIESRLFPDSRPPQVGVAGARFETNKSFIRPEAEDDVRRVRELDAQEPERKIAIFGHTDRVGADASNSDLSRARAGSMNALLRHDEGFWYDRFALHETLGAGIPEQKFALRDLGHFTGPIDGTASADFDAAVSAFRAAHGLAATGGNAAARRAMGEALLQKIGATFAPLRNESAWGLREIQSMLQALGHYGGPINGVNSNATQTAVRAFQASEGLTQDGSVGLITRIALIRAYQRKLVPTALAPDRFHAGAVFGCGEAFPLVPTPDNVESAQNRRVEVIFRRTPVTPIDPTQVGAAVPYLDWKAPEFDGAPPAEPPKVVVAITDTGFGRSSAADNFSGEPGRLPNDLLIKGERLLRPTDTSGANAGNPALQTVFVDGNLQGVGDVTALGGGAVPGGGHGTAVMTCLGADGVGSPVGGAARTARNTVLGTAPHVHVRPIRISASGGGANFFSYLLALEIMARDPEVLVHTTSIADWVATLSFTPQQLRALQERAQEMVMQGKLMFSVPQNYNGGAFPNRYWAGTTQWGRLGPDKRNARSTNAGANVFRQRLEIVGATARVGRAPAGTALTVNAPGQQELIADFSFIGEQVGIFMPGSQIRSVMPSAAGLAVRLGAPVPIAGQNLTVGGIDGTSFATPMTAGVAGELMLLDPDLRQPANVARVLEYMEATADPLPNVNAAGGTGAPANPRVGDPNIGAAAHPSFSGIRRVHFWKAVLAALNKGLSAEGRGAAGAQDAFFTFCTLRDDASTEFYGFEIRSPVADATVWLRKASGEIVPAHDAGAVFPASRTSASCWRTVDALQVGPNQPLPAFPWPIASFPAGQRPFFLCQFSIGKAQLAEFQSLVAHLPGADPRQPGGADSPPVFDLRIDDRPTLRNPGAIAPGAPARQQALRTFVQAFDDFVFQVSAVPQPLAGFVLFAQGHRTGLGVGEAVPVFVYAVDQFGNLTDPGALAVNLTHNGTPGAAAPAAGVFLNGNPAAPAGVALAFGAAGDPPGMARVQFLDNTAEIVTLSVNDGAGHAGSVNLQVAAAGAVASLQVEVRRRGGGASVVAQPPFAGEPLEVAVSSVDGAGRVRTDFTGEVRLRVAQGETGSAGPPPARGVHVKVNDGDAFSEAAFRHVFTAADAGQHSFPIFSYTAGPLQIEASGGGATGRSEPIEVVAGPVASFAVQASSPQTAGRRFELALTALDAHQNRVEQFAGAVALSLAAGTAGAAGPPPDGVFLGDTALVADDTVSFTQADGGVKRVPVTCFRAENVTFRATHNPPGGGAAIVSNSSPIQIQAAGALHHFRFEITGAQRAGSTFQLRVVAEDSANSRLTGFAGNVQIGLVAGTAFNAVPVRQGVLVETAAGVAGNAHVFAPADAGAFTFLVTPFTAEQVTLSATDGAGITTNTPALPIQAGLFAQFAVLPAGGAHANVPFALRVEARDTFNNVVQNFLGQVSLSVRPGAGAFAAVPAPTGQHAFALADAGVHVFNLTVGSSGAGHQVQATDGNVVGTSAAFNVAP